MKSVLESYYDRIQIFTWKNCNGLKSSLIGTKGFMEIFKCVEEKLCSAVKTHQAL